MKFLTKYPQLAKYPQAYPVACFCQLLGRCEPFSVATRLEHSAKDHGPYLYSEAAV